MKAAVLHQFDTAFSMDEVMVSEPARNEVLVKVEASGVCHSDRINQLAPGMPLRLPFILGHEVAGVVEAVGSDVTYVSPGDHVVVTAVGFCGTCRWCQIGEPAHCEFKGRDRSPGEAPRLTAVNGEAVEAFVGVGGFAEYVLVHQGSVSLVSKDMPFDRAALLGCSVMTAFGAVRRGAKIESGQTVAVIGCGGVGLSVIQAARLAGASRIIAVDRIGVKLEMARRFGATDVVDASEVDSVDAVRELTVAGVDHAIEVVGLPKTIQQAFAMLDIKGTATVLGVTRPGITVEIPSNQLLQDKKLQGIKLGGARPRIDIPLYAELYLDGRLQLDELISSRISLDELNVAMENLEHPTGARSVITSFAS